MIKMARLAGLITALLLTGCGFAPMYGKHEVTQQSAVASGLNDVYIDNIPDRDGQYLRNLLIDRFYSTGRPADPKYTLIVAELNEEKRELDLTKSAETTRAQLRITANIALVDRATGQQVLGRQLLAITSYNILQSEFSTRVTEDNARLNALADLARQIELALALQLTRQ